MCDAPENLVAQSFHEAGHAVVGVYLGMEMEYIRLGVGADRRSGHTHWKTNLTDYSNKSLMELRAVSLSMIAGHEAELLLSNQPIAEGSDFWDKTALMKIHGEISKRTGKVSDWEQDTVVVCHLLAVPFIRQSVIEIADALRTTPDVLSGSGAHAFIFGRLEANRRA